MLLLNLSVISSIEINEPKLTEELIYENGRYTKLYRTEFGAVETFPINNTLDIENIKNNTITHSNRVYSKPSISFKETDGKIRTEIFNTVESFKTFIETKIKPYYDKFLVL